jgi:excisionase family DNA binding protein
MIDTIQTPRLSLNGRADVPTIAAVVAETLRQLGLIGGMMSAADLAELLRTSEPTLWRWHASGKLGPVGQKVGGKRLWRRDEVEAWIAADCPERDRWAAIWKAKRS